jgi:23S rRNA pseudouridine1911/1915/1917 synthase
MTQKITVTIEERMRLDIYLAGELQISRAKVQKMIENDQVFVNEKLPRKAGDSLKYGDLIEIRDALIKEVAPEVQVEEVDYFPLIQIIKETDDYLVINKPAGLLVHPTEANETHTLAAWLVEKYPSIKKVGEDPVRPGIVHRLDREASGLLVVAKTQKMFKHLKAQFKNSEVVKEYNVLVHEVVEKDFGEIDFLIDRGPDGRMVSRPKIDDLSLKYVDKIQPGKLARTEFTVEKRFINYTLLKVRIHTGRTHQIRVHMFAYGYPVVGDNLYYNKRFRKYTRGLDRLFLNAYHLQFTDLKKNSIDTEIGMPQQLQNFLKTII